MSGRHAGLATGSRRSFALLIGATVLGLWFGLRAPDLSPVALPAAVQVAQAPAGAVAVDPVAPVAPVVPVTPVVPPGADGRGPRGGGR
jgi:hypothetical protein